MNITKRIIDRLIDYETETGNLANYIYLGEEEINELTFFLMEQHGTKVNKKFVLNYFAGLMIYVVDAKKHLNVC